MICYYIYNDFESSKKYLLMATEAGSSIAPFLYGIICQNNIVKFRNE